MSLSKKSSSLEEYKSTESDGGGTGSSAAETGNRLETLQKRGQQLTYALGEAVALLMRDPRFRHLTLIELEWMVLPAIVSNQILYMRGAVKPANGADENADGTGSDLVVPVGLALWARVSDEASEKLGKQKADGVPYRLSPAEWTSGDNLWLLALSGPAKILPALKEKLAKTAFKDAKFQEHVMALHVARGLGETRK